MKKSFVILSSLIVGLTASLIISNASASWLSRASNPNSTAEPHRSSKKKLTEADIIAEYNAVRTKRKGGYFGKTDSEGTQVIKSHETNIANYLALKVNAEHCRDIQTLIPSLETGYYIFSSTASDVNTAIAQQTRFFSSFIGQSVKEKDIQDFYFEIYGPKPIARRCNSLGSIIAAMTPIL